jgi:hypothetical protein
LEETGKERAGKSPGGTKGRSCSMSNRLPPKYLADPVQQAIDTEVERPCRLRQEEESAEARASGNRPTYADVSHDSERDS